MGQLIDLVQFELRQMGGQMMGQAITPAMMMKYANMGANILANEAMCLKYAQSFPTASGDDYYEITPMIDITHVVYDDTRILPLDMSLLNKIDDTQGTPLNYQFEEPKHIRLFPIPNEAKTVWYYGYRWPTPVSSDGDSIDLPTGLADVCMDYVLWRCGRVIQPELGDSLEAAWRRQLSEYVRAAKKRSGDTVHEIEDQFFSSNQGIVGSGYIKIK